MQEHAASQSRATDGASDANQAEELDATVDSGGQQRELQDARDRLLRIQAEHDNYRKRMRREMDDERKYAESALLRDLLPVVDNIERAIEAGAQSAEGLLAGVKLVAQQLQDVLQRHHCRRIADLGQPFDPNRHQAITTQPNSELPPNTVLQVVQAGFELHDRVLRPAQVIVSASAPSGGTTG